MPIPMTRLGFIACALAIVMTTNAALADETTAQRLFREGRALMLVGKFDEACPKIAESHRLDPHVGTLLNLAACHEKQGKIATAWVEFQKALTAARAEGQADRVRLAQDRLDVLEPRVPWLTIAVTAQDGLEVTLDGATIQSAAYGKEMPVDPGAHVVAASSPGKKSFEERFELRESEKKTVTASTPDLVATPPPPPPKETRIVVDPQPSPARPKDDPTPSAHGRWLFEAGLVAGYLGANTQRATLVGSAGSIAIRENATGKDMSCATQTCSYALPQSGGGLAGVSLFAGYAAADRLHVGVRLLVGPVLARGGGSLVAIGPSMSFQVGSALWVGASLYLGTASIGGNGTVTPSVGFSSNASLTAMTASTDLGAGAGLELGVKLFDVGRGSFGLNVAPFFLLGSNGNAWGVPFGILYRFQ